MRSVTNLPSDDGIAAVVAQQFDVAAHSPSTGSCRSLSRKCREHQALCHQPRNRAVMHIEAARDLAHRLTVTVAALDGLAPLVRCELWLAAEPHPTGLGSFPPHHELEAEGRPSALLSRLPRLAANGRSGMCSEIPKMRSSSCVASPPRQRFSTISDSRPFSYLIAS